MLLLEGPGEDHVHTAVYVCVCVSMGDAMGAYLCLLSSC